MSKIIDKITAELTGTRYAVEPLIEIEQHNNVAYDLDFLSEYFVGVRLGHKMRLREDDVKEALPLMRKALTELIFGEFRGELSRLQYQLYNRDFEGAQDTAREIERRMFYD